MALTRFNQTLAICAAIVASGFPAAVGATPDQSVTSAQLVTLAEQAIEREARNSSLSSGATRIEVTAGALDSRLRFDACSDPIAVRVDQTRLQSRINVKVSCSAPTPWSVYVPAQLRIFRPVVVSTQDLQSGTSLTADDVMLAERDVLTPGSPALQSLDQAIGFDLRRPVSANSVITANSVQQPLLVRRGDRVNISSETGGIAVRAAAEALDSGRTGERIRVKNVQTKRIVEVTVTGPGQARVI